MTRENKFKEFKISSSKLDFSPGMEERLKKHREGEGELTAAHLAFRRAAALLPRFDPQTLKPADSSAEGNAVFHLFKDSIVHGASGVSSWSLRPDVRRRALQSLAGPQAALEALKANAQTAVSEFASEFVELLRDYLESGVPALAQQSHEQLLQTLKAVRWLSLIPGIKDLPGEDEVYAAIERSAIFEPFHRLVDNGFFGRGAELDLLRNYVGVVEAEELWGRLSRFGSELGRLFGSGTAPPLLIHGPGGVGKSTLIAQFVLEHLERPQDKLPFAYLDFERSLVTALEPMSLVVEMARQLRVQYPEHAADFSSLESAARAESERQAGRDQERLTKIWDGRYQPDEARDQAKRLRSNRRRRESRLLGELAQLLARASGRRRDEPTDQDEDVWMGEEQSHEILISADDVVAPSELAALIQDELDVELDADLDELTAARRNRYLATSIVDALARHESKRTLVLQGLDATTSDLEDFVSVLANRIAKASGRVRLVLRDYDGSLGKRARKSKRVVRQSTKIETVPFLVVLDSFERTQYRSYLHLSRLWNFFESFQKAYPKVRVVVSGRAPVKGLKLQRQDGRQLRLKELPAKYAVAMLESRSGFDRETASSLVDTYGGNPLTLRLLARLDDDQLGVPEDAAQLKKDRSWWSLSREEVDDAVVQAMLYERILGQIEDESVRRLAHPGLVLRRITPDVIEHVLAPRCKQLDVDGPEAAEALYLALERQVDLVEVVRPGVLGHRPEIRAVMLRLLEQDQREMVTDIEQAAVAYYALQEGDAEARAEEIYHRLRLGESPDDIHTLWQPGLERYFSEDSIDEVPESARAFLSSRISGLAAPSESDSVFDLEYIEQALANQGKDLLAGGHAEEALEVVEQVSHWSEASPLAAVKAQALTALGRDEEAETVVAEHLLAAEQYARLVRDVAPRQVAQRLRALAARYASARGDQQASDEHLAAASTWAQDLGDDASLLGILWMRARLRREGDGAGVKLGEHEAISGWLHELFMRMADQDLLEFPDLVASVGIELGEVNADALSRAIALLDWHDFSGPTRSLEEAIVDQVASEQELETWLRGYAERSGQMLSAFGPEDVAQLVNSLVSDSKLSTFLIELNDKSADSSSVRESIIDCVKVLRDGARARTGSVSDGDD